MNNHITTWRSRQEREQKREIAQMLKEIGIAILVVVGLYYVLNIVLGLN